MKIKKGVRLAGIRPEIAIALQVVAPILLAHGQECVITSAMEGKYKRASAHYSGRAVDLRIWALTSPQECVQKLSEALGDDFDVLLEGNHIHMEFDPKMGANL